MIPRLLLILSLLAVAVWCQAGGKPSRIYAVTFHLEGEEKDNPKFNVPVKLGQESRQYIFSKIPTFTDNDVSWFYPFTAADGVSFGAAFKFKEHAAQELKGVTLTNQGKLLGIRAADAPIQAVLIDRPIDDGVVVIWSGLTQEHLEKFQKEFPHVDDFKPKNKPATEMPQR